MTAPAHCFHSPHRVHRAHEHKAEAQADQEAGGEESEDAGAGDGLAAAPHGLEARRIRLSPHGCSQTLRWLACQAGEEGAARRACRAAVSEGGHPPGGSDRRRQAAGPGPRLHFPCCCGSAGPAARLQAPVSSGQRNAKPPAAPTPAALPGPCNARFPRRRRRRFLVLQAAAALLAGQKNWHSRDRLPAPPQPLQQPQGHPIVGARGGIGAFSYLPGWHWKNCPQMVRAARPLAPVLIGGRPESRCRLTGIPARSSCAHAPHSRSRPGAAAGPSLAIVQQPGCSRRASHQQLVSSSGQQQQSSLLAAPPQQLAGPHLLSHR